MPAINNKRVQSVLIAVVVLVVVACSTMHFPALGEDTGSSRAKLSDLLEERRSVLKARVDIVHSLFTIARTTPEAVVTAQDDLLDAEYELATSRAQRLDVLKRQVESAKKYESLMEQRKKDAQCTEADVLMAKARRLGVEIKLLRAQE